MLWHFRTLEVEGEGYTCATTCSWAKKFMKINSPLGLFNVKCSTCRGISELKKWKEKQWVVLISCYTCATLCSWAKKVMTSNTPLGLSNVYCTVLHTLWHFRTLEGEEKGVSSCYIFYICTAMCSWARKFKRTPGVAQCTLNSVVHAVAF